jgi:hypothetical protein
MVVNYIDPDTIDTFLLLGSPTNGEKVIVNVKLDLSDFVSRIFKTKDEFDAEVKEDRADMPVQDYYAISEKDFENKVMYVLDTKKMTFGNRILQFLADKKIGSMTIVTEETSDKISETVET